MSARARERPPTWDEIAPSITVVLFLVLLLGGVAGGYIFAVEGAAAERACGSSRAC